MSNNTKLYHLPSDDYHPDFIKALAMATYLDLVEPAELTFMFESKLPQFKIAEELFLRVKAYAKMGSYKW